MSSVAYLIHLMNSLRITRVASKIVSNRHGYQSTLRAVDESVAKIGGKVQPSTCVYVFLLIICIGYIDLFLIHNPNSGKKLRLETYKALLEKRDAGLLRDVGVSN